MLAQTAIYFVCVLYTRPARIIINQICTYEYATPSFEYCIVVCSDVADFHQAISTDA